MKIEFQLRYAHDPQRPAVAWLFSGSEPSTAESTPSNHKLTWLGEVASWPVAQSAIQFRPLGSALGWLVLPAPVDAAKIGEVSTSAIPYGVIGSRLFLPVHSTLHPHATDREIERLLPDDRALYVWHPTAGLLRSEPADAKRFAELLYVPACRSATWSRAVSGTQMNSRLVLIAPEATPSAAEVMESVRGDIASQPLSLSRLPPSPREVTPWQVWSSRFFRIMLAALFVIGLVLVVGMLWSVVNNHQVDSGPPPATPPQVTNEPVSPLAPLVDMITQIPPEIFVPLLAALLFMLVRDFVSFVGRKIATRSGAGPPSPGQRTTAKPMSGTAGSGGLFAGIRQLWQQHRKRVSEQLEALRHREVERLLHMLESRPEDGLRFALPVGGEALSRGVAEPGSQLTERGTSFNMSRLGGGGPTDYWDIGDSYRQRLTTKYHDLARREIALGNHRRAAYIYAELLGNLRLAAATLAEGGAYREAAALYRERLLDKHAAAICLEKGGLLMDAIPIYRELGNHLKVAELYELLQQPDFAAEAYREAVQVKLQQADFLSAADLLEHKLRCPDEALETLLRGWPHSPQAERCLDEAFQLLARQAAHDRAASQILAIAKRGDRSPLAVQVTRTLAKLAARYPDATIQHLAAEQTRILVARRLEDDVPTERTALLDAVRSLAPHDRLLARDCTRFAQRTHRPTQPVRRREKIQVVNHFQLPPAEWKTAIVIGKAFYAAGYSADEMLLVRGLWDGTLQRAAGKPYPLPTDTAGVLLAGWEANSSNLYVQPFGLASIEHEQTFAETGLFWERRVLPHPALGPSTLAMHSAEPNILRTLAVHDSNLQIEEFQVQRLFGTQAIQGCSLSQLCFCPRGMVRIGLSTLLTGLEGVIEIDCAGEASIISTPQPVFGLYTTNDSSSPQVVAVHPYGATHWNLRLSARPADNSPVYFAEDLQAPVCCFLDRDRLAIADAQKLEIYVVDKNNLQLYATHAGPQQVPIALLTTTNRSRAALVTASGSVVVYEVS